MKIIGYLLSTIGLIIFALSVKPIKEGLAKYLPFLSSISNNILMIIGGVFIIIGVILAFRFATEKQPIEVPIYQGKNIVGFRRLGKR